MFDIGEGGGAFLYAKKVTFLYAKDNLHCVTFLYTKILTPSKRQTKVVEEEKGRQLIGGGIR